MEWSRWSAWKVGHRWRWGGVGLVVLLASGQLAWAANLRYTSGHADIGIAYEDGWNLHVHLEPLAVVDGELLIDDIEAEPPTVDILVPKTTRQVRPASSAWDFLGVGPGEEFYRLSQSSIQAATEGAPYLGVATAEIGPGTFVGNQITLSLTGLISAPAGGHFSLYQTGPTRFWDTFDGDFANDRFAFPVGVHEHFHYGFSKKGIYEVEITATGLHMSDGWVSGSAVYRFVVPEPGTWALAGLGGLVLAGWVKRRRQ